MPPDVTAAIFWLKNRDPQHWRDSQQLEHVLGKYLISDKPMTEEEWVRERATVIDVLLWVGCVDVVAPQVHGKFISGFVRAVKPKH